MTSTIPVQSQPRLPAAESFSDWENTFGLITKRPRLLHRLDATKNQNRQDYLMRLTSANNLRGIEELSKVLGLTFSFLVTMPAEALNAFLAGKLDIDARQKKNKPHLGLFLLKHGLSAMARVCPKCIVANLPMDVGLNLAIPVPCPSFLPAYSGLTC